MKDSLQKNDTPESREQILLSQTEALAQTGSWEFDIKTNSFFWSDGVFRILEIEPQSFEVTYEKAMEVIHPEDRKQSAAFMKECIAHGIDYLNEKRFMTKTNKIKFIHSSGKVLRDKEGNPEKIIGVYQDITPYRNFENNIQYTLTALQERVKEQTCLYKIASLSNDTTTDISEILSQAAKILPDGFLYPKQAQVLVNYGTMLSFGNEKQISHPWIKAVRMSIENEELSVIIGYNKTMPQQDEGPFLQEERQLIESIGDTLLLKINQIVTNKKLKDYSAQNEMLLQSTEEGIYGINEQGFCTFINHAGAKMLGYTPGECIGKNIHQLIHYKKENGEPFLEEECPIYKTRKSKDGCRIESEVFWRKDGSSMPVRYSSTPIFQKGKAKGSVIVFNDITDSKKAHHQVQQSKDELQRILDYSLDFICTIDINGNFILVNKACEEILGYRPSEMIGHNLFEFIHIDDHDKTQAAVEKIYSLKEISDFENTYVHKKGHLVPIVWSSYWDEERQHLYSIGRDDSERKKAEIQLQLSEKRFKSLVQEGSDLIGILDAQGTYIYVSPTSTPILGISPEEYIGKNAFDYIHEEDKAGVEEIFTRLATEKRIEIKPFRFLDKNGDWHWIETIVTNMIDDPIIGGIVANSRDVTEKVLANHQMALSEKRFRAMVQEGSDLISIVSPDGFYKYNSPNYPYILGYETLELTGKKAWDYFHPNDIERIRKEFSKLATQKRVKSSPYRFRHKTGKWCWLQSVATNLLTVEAVKGIIVNSVDISALMKTQDTLQKSNERFEYLNKASSDAIYDWDVLNDNFQWGEGFKRIFGHNYGEADKFSLADWKKLTHPDDLIKGETTKFLKDKNKTRWTKEFRFLRADGSFAYVEEIGHLIRDKKGKPVRMIGVLRDVSETKLTQIEREIQHEVSGYFNEDIALQNSIKKSLSYLTEFGKFKTAELWMVGTNKNYIHLQSTYSDKTSRVFFRESKNVTRLSKNEGFPGRVWKNHQVEIMKDIQSNKSFIRSKAANKAGLNAALGIPLWHYDAVIGVMIFYNDVAISGINDQTTLYGSLGRFFGTEIKRKQNEEEMYLLFQSSPEILAISSPDGKFSKVNPAFCTLLGYSEEEITTQPFVNFLHPDDQKATIKEYKKTKSGKNVAKNFVNRYRTRSGDYKWISWSSSKGFGEEGQVFAYGHDITEIKELQNLLETVTQLSKVGGWEVDVINQKLFWSKIIRQIHEVPDTFEPDLKTAIGFYKEGYSKDLITKLVDEAFQTGKSYDVELQIVTAKGKEKWIRTIGNAEFVNGQCVRLYGSTQDIDKQKQAEIRLKSISDNIPGILFQYQLNPDNTDQLLNVSKGAIEIWGIPPEECESNTQLVWKGIREGGDYEIVQKSIMESVQNLSRWKASWRYVMPDGSLRYHEGFGNPHKLANGGTVCDSIITDITEQHELENLAERTAKMARIGSWEINFTNHNHQKNYWSPMTREILEVGDSLKPSFKKVGSNSKIMKAIKRMIETGDEFDEEFLITTAENNSKWIRLIGHADQVGDKTVKVFGSIQDIHEQKTAEMHLQQAFLEKNTILESIGDAFFAVDKNWIVTYWNKEAEKLLGKKREETVGISLWESYKDAVSLNFYNEYHKAVKTGETVHFEEYYPTTNQWFEVSAYPSNQGLSVYFKDVSIRKTAEEQIKRSNERFEKVSKATNDAIWDWDIITNSYYRGEGYKMLFGYDSEKINSYNLYAHWKEKIHQDDIEEVLTSLDNAIENQDVTKWQQEYRFKKSNGQYAFIVDSGLIIRNRAGKATRMVGAMSDLTYQKETEESLKKLNIQLERHARDLALSNEELEQFAYVASHDLQEPLRMVSSFLTQLEKKYGHQFDEKAHQYIHFAVDGAKRMRQIILDLLEFSRVGKNKEDGLEEINLNELIKEICQLNRRIIEGKNAQIIFSNLPVIIAYKTPITQIFQNLIGNALKYSREDVPPRIEVTAKEFKFQWLYTVQDNGIGMEEEYFEKIFILFQRLHNKEVYSGTGMGLSIVKKILDNLGGQIWVDSKPGSGSTFHFTIPKKEK